MVKWVLQRKMCIQMVHAMRNVMKWRSQEGDGYKEECLPESACRTELLVTTQARAD